MQPTEFDLNDAVAILERTPATLSAMLAGIPEQWARTTEGADDWSPLEVIGHLIQGELTNWMPRTRHILSAEQRPFDPFDRTPLAGGHKPAIDELLATFGELRRQNIAALKDLKLTGADLERTGLHPELGEVRLKQLLASWVVHDLNHLVQIARTLARVYGAAVGPWNVYLAILHERE